MIISFCEFQINFEKTLFYQLFFKVTQWTLWILTIVNILGTSYLLRKSFSLVGMAIIFTALSRSVWSLGIGWIVISCSTGNGGNYLNFYLINLKINKIIEFCFIYYTLGFINTFLSLKIFVPLSKLTYCAYLTNPIVIVLLHFNADVPMHVDSTLEVSRICTLRHNKFTLIC